MRRCYVLMSPWTNELHKGSEELDRRLVLQGLVQEIDDGEAGDILHIGRHIPAEELEFCQFTEPVWCVFAFSNRPIGPADLNAAAIEAAEGFVEAEYGHRYSEITGYLWTDEGAKIGGHDLLAILRSHLDEWACVVVQTYPVDLMHLAESSSV